MALLGERLAAVEAHLQHSAEVLERVELALKEHAADRLALEHRITTVESSLTFRTWIGGALMAALQGVHYLLPGLPGTPGAQHL